MERALVAVITLGHMKELTLGRNHINAWNVERALVRVVTLGYIKGLTLGRNHINAWNLEGALFTAPDKA